MAHTQRACAHARAQRQPVFLLFAFSIVYMTVSLLCGSQHFLAGAKFFACQSAISHTYVFEQIDMYC